MITPRVFSVLLAGLAAAACTDEPASPPATDTPAAASPQADGPPYRPAATTRELMESLIAHAAEEYWGSVRIVIDEQGVTEYFPETDEDWEEVWAAGLSIAESGNLLMMPWHSRGEEWNRLSGGLVEAGLAAARAALERDPDKVLDAGERVYNACVACHDRYLPAASP